MDNGMESMLDTYLFETNSLLDNLDEMLVKIKQSCTKKEVYQTITY